MIKRFAKLSRGKKILSMVGSVALVAILAIVFTFSYQGSTKDIEKVADSFRPGASWRQMQRQVEPYRFACLSGTCPYVHISWHAMESISEENYNDYLKSSIVKNMQIDSCQRHEIQGSTKLSCEAHGEYDGYVIRSFLDYSSREGATVSVSIKENS